MGKGRGLALAGMLFLVSVQPLTAFAGSINGNEQELLNVISGTETYNGRTYRMNLENDTGPLLPLPRSGFSPGGSAGLPFPSHVRQ